MNPLPAWKRCLDLAACLVALPFLALLTLVVALVMWRVSPGPVFFRQERVGLRGRRFKIFKFRTMKVGADHSVHQQYFKNLIGTNAPMRKLDALGDSRLLPGGRLVRAAGLDELPQILNVLRGEMSLVGPRPCLPAEFADYAPGQRRRCDALPGLTGLWQVSGKNRTTVEQMMRLDLEYAARLSMWRDLRIILLTVPALVRQVGDSRRGPPLRRPPSPAAEPPVSRVAFRPPSLSVPEPAGPLGLSEEAVRSHWSYTRASFLAEIRSLDRRAAHGGEDFPTG